MHEPVYVFSVAWSVGLVLVLVVFAYRNPRIMPRTLALEVLSLLMAAVLGIVAIARDSAGYLDIAMVIVMLGFAQTVATRRLVARRRRPR